VLILRSNALVFFFFLSAEDLRRVLRGKHLLARIELARLYDRKAGEVLRTIKVSSY
jgi:hypothetical protein